MDTQSGRGPGHVSIFIDSGTGEYRVQPPMPVARGRDEVTFFNRTKDRVLVRFPDGLMDVSELTLDGSGKASVTIDEMAFGVYYYFVGVIITAADRKGGESDHGFVLARGNSSPGIIVDY